MRGHNDETEVVREKRGNETDKMKAGEERKADKQLKKKARWNRTVAVKGEGIKNGQRELLKVIIKVEYTALSCCSFTHLHTHIVL